MSYSRKDCRKKFTSGQAIRMRAALLNSIVLQDVLSIKCMEIKGPSIICFGTDNIYELSDTPPDTSTTSWSSSANIDILSSTDFSATIETLSSSGQGTLTATINGYDINKTIQLGQPDVSGITLGAPPYLIEVNTISAVRVKGNVPFATGYYFEISSPNLPNCQTANFGLDANGNPITSITTNGVVDVHWGSCAGATYFIDCWVETPCGRQYLDEFSAKVKKIPCIETQASPNPYSGEVVHKLSIRLVLLPPCDPPRNGVRPDPGTPGDLSIFDLRGNEQYSGRFTLNENYTANVPSNVMNSLPPDTYIVQLLTDGGKKFSTTVVVE